MKYIISTIIVLLIISGFFLFRSKDTNSNDQVFKKVSGSEARKIIDTYDNVVIIDVRTLEEYNTNHIEASVLIPYDIINKEIVKQYPNKNTHIIVYCRSGNRSSIAANTLKQLGYNYIYDLGAINNW